MQLFDPSLLKEVNKQTLHQWFLRLLHEKKIPPTVSRYGITVDLKKEILAIIDNIKEADAKEFLRVVREEVSK